MMGRGFCIPENALIIPMIHNMKQKMRPMSNVPNPMSINISGMEIATITKYTIINVSHCLKWNFTIGSSLFTKKRTTETIIPKRPAIQARYIKPEKSFDSDVFVFFVLFLVVLTFFFGMARFWVIVFIWFSIILQKIICVKMAYIERNF